MMMMMMMMMMTRVAIVAFSTALQEDLQM